METLNESPAILKTEALRRDRLKQRIVNVSAAVMTLMIREGRMSTDEVKKIGKDEPLVTFGLGDPADRMGFVSRVSDFLNIGVGTEEASEAQTLGELVMCIFKNFHKGRRANYFKSEPSEGDVPETDSRLG